MKKKISFKKMLDIGTGKTRTLQKVKPPSKDRKIAKETKEKIEKKHSVKKTSPDQKIVLFRLGSEYYAINVDMIEEIIESVSMEKITGMPHYIAGVISLRKESIPVISLFKKFHIRERNPGKTETVLITNYNSKTYGILVDELKGVLDIESSSIFDVPLVYSDEELSYLEGIIKYETEIAAIVDIKKVLMEFKLG